MAEIQATVVDPQGIDPDILWETVTENDTCNVVAWPGGAGYIQVAGTFGGGTVTFKYGFTEDLLIDANVSAPDDGTKLTFTTDSLAAFEFPEGFLTFTTAGGTSQDVDIRIRPKRAD